MNRKCVRWNPLWYLLTSVHCSACSVTDWVVWCRYVAHCTWLIWRLIIFIISIMLDINIVTFPRICCFHFQLLSIYMGIYTVVTMKRASGRGNIQCRLL